MFLVVLKTNLLSLLNITDIILRASGKRNPAPNSASGAKKKSNQGKFNLWADKYMLNKGLETLHGGQRILLKAEEIWGAGNVPAGQEKYLYQYHIYQINEDYKTAIIKFDEKYVEEGRYHCVDFPNPERDTKTTINKYKLARAKEDKQLFNLHLGCKKKINNDRKEDLRKEEKSQKVTESCDLSNILQNIEDHHCDAYSLLVN